MKTGQVNIEAAERQRQAIELRRSGCTFDEIAEQLGYSGRGSAYKAVRKALRNVTRQPVLEFLALELSRLDALQQAVWPQAINGDYKAADTVLKIMDRRASYLGLNAPPGGWPAPDPPSPTYTSNEAILKAMEVLAEWDERHSESGNQEPTEFPLIEPPKSTD